jgi:hypothetical protein
MEIKEWPKNPRYLIYEDGRIYSKLQQKFLIPKVMHDGYLRVQLSIDHKTYNFMWHRVVLETFIQPESEKLVVNHKNGIKTDNRLCNLEWCTQKENIKHSWETGLSKPLFNHPKMSKSITQFDINMNKINEFPSITEASRKLFIERYKIRYSLMTGKLLNNYYFKYSKTSND